ncbi:MAG: hypothetical protein HC910_17810 [Spirulinaceae cyanobacterium SM2_1_0]|nr:hypothetical protein [Spirulinaceae cyanobacterium SM2_1_0]
MPELNTRRSRPGRSQREPPTTTQKTRIYGHFIQITDAARTLPTKLVQGSGNEMPIQDP